MKRKVLSMQILRAELTPEQLANFEKVEREKDLESALETLPAMDTDETSDPVNERIKAIRLENGLSQNDLANVLDISQKEYWRYEQSGCAVNPRRLKTIATFYNVSLDWFFGVADEKKPLYEEAKRIYGFGYTLSDILQLKATGEKIKTYDELMTKLKDSANEP